MNYIRIYHEFLVDVLSTSPHERIVRRGKERFYDFTSPLYLENHHIIPKHEGGSDNSDNLVFLLPEEHYFIHLLRYKAFKNPNDFLAVRIIVSGYKSKSDLKDKIPNAAYQSLMYQIGNWKRYIAEFKRVNNWHTPDGLNRISKARMGKMPCINVETGESVGHVDINHINVKLGKWVHHSKNKRVVRCVDSNHLLVINKSDFDSKKHISIARNMSGVNNPNYRPLLNDDREYLYKCISLSIVDGNHFIKKLFLIELRKNNKFAKRSDVWIKNRFGSIENMLDEYNMKFCTNIVYNKHYRSSAQKAAARKFNLNKDRKC